MIFTVAAANLVPAKAGLGEADLQPRYLNMRDYTFLRKSAKSSGVEVRLWESGSGSQLALYPNLNAKDEVWRKLMRDVRFRRALSLGVDRDELNEVVYIGLANPSNNTIMPRSALFKPEYATKWATYDPKQANKLLDEIGLTKRNDQGFRLLPDGRPATIIVEHTSEETEDADALSLIADHWKKIGIKMLFKPQTRRELPPARLLRRGDHDRLCRRHHRGADRRHQPQGVRADHAGRPAMVALGHVRREQGQAGREVRPAGRPASCST